MTERKGLREQHQRHARGATAGPAAGRWRCPPGLLLATLAAGLLSAGCERNPADNLLRSPPADEPSATAGAPAGQPAASPPADRGVEMEAGSATPVPVARQGTQWGVTMDEMMSHHGPGYIRGFAATPYPPRPDQQTASAQLAADPAPKQGGVVLSAPSIERMEATGETRWSVAD